MATDGFNTFGELHCLTVICKIVGLFLQVSTYSSDVTQWRQKQKNVTPFCGNPSTQSDFTVTVTLTVHFGLLDGHCDGQKVHSFCLSTEESRYETSNVRFRWMWTNLCCHHYKRAQEKKTARHEPDYSTEPTCYLRQVNFGQFSFSKLCLGVMCRFMCGLRWVADPPFRPALGGVILYDSQGAMVQWSVCCVRFL